MADGSASGRRTARKCAMCRMALIGPQELGGEQVCARCFIHEMRVRDRVTLEFAIAVWAEEELSELGRGLRESVRIAMRGREIVRQRLSFRIEALVGEEL